MTETKKNVYVKKDGKVIGKFKMDEMGVDNVPNKVDVPVSGRGGKWMWNFEKKVPVHDKITWVLTMLNIVILISFVVTHLN